MQVALVWGCQERSQGPMECPPERHRRHHSRVTLRWRVDAECQDPTSPGVPTPQQPRSKEEKLEEAAGSRHQPVQTQERRMDEGVDIYFSH